jgi:methylenetetrahydrofolate--tRNA-(uracil-5-)-methyltransferase
MCGALLHYITHAEPENFQPMKANMGLLPEIPQRIRSKPERYAAYAERAYRALDEYLQAANFSAVSTSGSASEATAVIEPVVAEA